MTVAALIEKLKEFPQDMIVAIQHEDPLSSGGDPFEAIKEDGIFTVDVNAKADYEGIKYYPSVESSGTIKIISFY